MGEQGVPAGRRIAEPESGCDFAAQSALLQVVDGAFCVGVFAQLGPVETVGAFQQRKVIVAPLPVRRRRAGARLARNLQPQRTRQLLDCFGELQVLVLHQKADRAAVGAAAEAVVELLAGADGEGWRFLVMERAAGLVLAAGLFQRHPGVDDIHDINAVEEFIDETLRDAAGHAAMVRGERRRRQQVLSRCCTWSLDLLVTAKANKNFSSDTFARLLRLDGYSVVQSFGYAR